MFSSNLSLDQAPPLSAPLRFFLTAPLFAIIASIFIIVNPEAMFMHKDLMTIAVVHLFTIGYFGLIMLGALQQMLPVLAGVNLPRPVVLATLSHILMVLGTLGLSFGLIYFHSIIMISSLMLFAGFAIILLPSLLLLLKGDFQNPTINGMRIAIVFGLLTVLLGVHLGLSYSNYNFSVLHQSFVDLHIAMGTMGWILVLVISVAFQVIPMFYVTPKFSKFCMKWPFLIAGIILFWGLFVFEIFTGRVVQIVGVLLFVVAMSAFASVGLKRFTQRKRPIADTTVWYWRLSLGSLLLTALVLIAKTVLVLDGLEYLVGVLFGFGFGVSVLNGMLYKIIPFLSWFHLSATGRFDIPTMRDFLPEKGAKRQFYLHLVALIALLISFFIHELLVVAGIVLLLSFLYLWFNLIQATKLYVQESKKEPVMAGGMSWN